MTVRTSGFTWSVWASHQAHGLAESGTLSCMFGGAQPALRCCARSLTAVQPPAGSAQSAAKLEQPRLGSTWSATTGLVDLGVRRSGTFCLARFGGRLGWKRQPSLH